VFSTSVAHAVQVCAAKIERLGPVAVLAHAPAGRVQAGFCVCFDKHMCENTHGDGQARVAA
jgi:hypothetical protein